MEYLDFELPIAELEAKIESLKAVAEQDNKINLDDEIKRLEKKAQELTKKTFANLDAWQTSKMARHPNRPYTLDYIEHIFTEFDELAGDRAFADDKAIVGGHVYPGRLLTMDDRICIPTKRTFLELHLCCYNRYYRWWTLRIHESLYSSLR